MYGSPSRTNVLFKTLGSPPNRLTQVLCPSTKTRGTPGRKSSAVNGRNNWHAKELECARSDEASSECLAAIRTAVHLSDTLFAHYVLEDMVLFPDLEKLRLRVLLAVPWLALGRVVNSDDHDSLGIPIGKWVQQGILDHAENGGCGTDPKGKGQDGP